MKTIIRILLYIWQLPQNIVGLIVLAWAALSKRIEASGIPEFASNQRYYYVVGFPGGISLGEQVILNAIYHRFKGTTERHEYGHCLQSRVLGPLYLIIVGLPSLIWAAMYEYNPQDPNKYYRFYTEKWADKWGGVGQR